MEWTLAETRTFDPLGTTDPAVLTAAIKQRVRNIIRSYNHPADLLAEPLQNAVDEVEEASRAAAVERGEIRVRIDCSSGKVSVRDNGRGLSTKDVERLLAPDVTGKADLFKSGRSRGHKGVGLTFLAYGFNFFELESRTATEHYRVRIENARRWVEDAAQTEIPRAQLTFLEDEEGELRTTGTCVVVQVGGQTEPRDLHRTFSSPEYARTVLESQTAIGVYPKSGAVTPSAFDAQLDYIARDGALTPCKLQTTYRFPHQLLKRGPKIFDLGSYLANNPPTIPPAKLSKKHESVYRFYSTDQLVSMLKGKADGDLLVTDGDVEALLRKHATTAYALAGFGAAYKETLSSSWSVPANRRLIAPGVRVATDGMISSWQRDLSLSHRGFNVERIWLVFHLNGVEPDLGRKDYPPEILELLALAEDPLADDVAKQGAPFLIPTTRSGGPIDYVAAHVKAAERRERPFLYSPGGGTSLGYLTEPQEEQDVVALFNELRGAGILPYFRPVFFSGSYAYDAYLEYHPDEIPEAVQTVLPGNERALASRHREGVAEFKFRANDILGDLVKETKSWNEILWLFCWDLGKETTKLGGLTLDITRTDAGDSPYAGVTHLATLDTAGERPIHVVALKTVLEHLGTTGGIAS